MGIIWEYRDQRVLREVHHNQEQGTICWISTIFYRLYFYHKILKCLQNQMFHIFFSERIFSFVKVSNQFRNFIPTLKPRINPDDVLVMIRREMGGSRGVSGGNILIYFTKN